VGHPGVDLIRTFLAESKVASGSIDDQRAAMDALAGDAPAPAGVEVEATTLADRPAEWLRPDGTGDGAAVLYLHGGGYCSGSLDSHRALAGRIARAARCAVVTLDYRLAPEHPFPSAVADATSAYRELLGKGLAPERLAIAGDSAGGGLTMATLLDLRGRGTPLPAAAVCLSPWVDLTQSSGAYGRLADSDPMVTGAGLDEMAAAYLAGTDPRNELASPLFAGELGGLPPVRVEVGAHEVLLDDATALAEGIRDAGGDVELVVWPEMIHVFQAFPGDLLPEADRSVEGIGAFLAGRLGGD
jgi:epsilon-lactone hydrolase